MQPNVHPVDEVLPLGKLTALGLQHMWPYGLTDGVVTYEPEGLLSTLGALINGWDLNGIGTISSMSACMFT